MAVSLKKSVKVDLSKPELPQKMREYTPIRILFRPQVQKLKVRPIPKSIPVVNVQNSDGA